MKVDETLHMVGGAGPTSYASNSRLQKKAIAEAKPIVEEGIMNICRTITPESLVVADLGCSLGPNAYLVMSEIMEAVAESRHQLGRCPIEIQFCLNDLPGNDFNTLFRSSALYDEQVRGEMGDKVVPYYVVGVPGSFYGRLFPRHSVHFFHSSYSLMWLSQVPSKLENHINVMQNKDNIYIAKSSPPRVYELYLEQFQRDFSTFLKLRSEEITLGGQMVISFLGRQSLHPSGKEYCYLWGLLAEALNEMVTEGFIEEEKLNTFDLPFYAPSLEEVKAIIESEGSFRLEKAQSFESNWDPFDDSHEDIILDNVLSGENVAKCIGAVVEPLLARHFKEVSIDALFSRYAKNVARHLLKEKTKHTVFIISLKIEEPNFI